MNEVELIQIVDQVYKRLQLNVVVKLNNRKILAGIAEIIGEAEKIVDSLGKEYGIDVRTIRLGPLVDYVNYTPPGRLGREVGTLFVAMGSKKGKLSLCDVKTASNVIRSYLENFEDAPPILNLVEPEAPTRKELMQRLLENRQELSVFWMPNFVLKSLSIMLKVVLKIMKPGKKPLYL